MAYLDEYYKGLPAFIFGSRVNGNSNGESDWDVGIIGAKIRRKIENIEFIPIEAGNIDKKCSRFPFNREIFSMVNRIKPLAKESEVREAEKRVKENMVQYAIQKSGEQEVSGKDVVTFYTRKNLGVNPQFLRKGKKFLNSKKVVNTSSEIYDDIIKNYNPTQKITYRDYGLLDLGCYFFIDKIRSLRETRFSNISDIFSYVKGFVNRASTTLKDRIASKAMKS